MHCRKSGKAIILLGMYSKYLPTVFVVISLLLALSTRAQDGNPLEDPDLKAALKQAQEMQKKARELQKNPGSLEAKSNGIPKALRRRPMLEFESL